MYRFLAFAAIVICATVVAGCGGSHHQPLGPQRQSVRLHGTHQEPVWLTNIIGRENRRFGDRAPGGVSISRSKQNDVVYLFGQFTHGTALRLVVSRRSHRVVSETVGHRIEGTQAPAIARRSDRYLSIFPATPGRAACTIVLGGTHLPGSDKLAGRCSTGYVDSPPFPHDAIRIRFGERWRLGGKLQVAAWIVTVRLSDGRVESEQVVGQPPQLGK